MLGCLFFAALYFHSRFFMILLDFMKKPNTPWLAIWEPLVGIPKGAASLWSTQGD
jgi:hypothetical protein